MTGEPEPRAGGLIVYIDRSEIHEGRLDDLKDGIRVLVEFIRAREPRLIAYGFHLDEAAGLMTVTAAHPDSASLELHLEIGREEFRKLGELITLRQVEVYGAISDRARGLLEQKVQMLGGRVMVSEPFSGFARSLRPES